MIPCPFYALTGWYCPLCGGQRLALALSHGDLGRAWAENPLVMVALGGVAVLLLLRLTRVYAVPVTLIRRPAVLWGIAVVMLAFGVARNLPGLSVLGPV
ncbi:MAG: DUF2752 domain-containing protein [Tetrasphaera jenkinsii]|jgi:hypothetical protein|nr:DUF2752 domain-containing protein [Tetrasphaera jenkinsii]